MAQQGSKKHVNITEGKYAELLMRVGRPPDEDGLMKSLRRAASLFSVVGFNATHYVDHGEYIAALLRSIKQVYDNPSDGLAYLIALEYTERVRREARHG